MPHANDHLSLQTEIDRLCDEFERAWGSGQLPDLRQFLADSGDIKDEIRSKLLSDLVWIDLEHRWRRADKSAETGQVVDKLGFHPTACDYAGLLLPKNVQPPVDWVVIEFRVRHLWGDRPAVSTFRRQYRDRTEVVEAIEDTFLSMRSDQRTNSGTSSTGMNVEIRCPSCGHRVPVGIDSDVEQVECDGCGEALSFVGDENEGAVATLGRFELEKRVGRGAFGVVWKAWDTQLRRHVALKFPRRSSLSSTELERVLREARAAAGLDHSHIVSIHDICIHENTPILVCRYIHGQSLDRYLDDVRMLSSQEAARLGTALADALEHAHSNGVIHRDLKPSNILLDQDGNPHITDFGLAKRQADEVTMTHDGQVLGTPAYMSPEQAEGRIDQIDCRSDVYSLGSILYELLTGERPFRGTVHMLLQQVVNETPPPLRQLNSAVPRDLETVTLRCLNKKRSDRYQTACHVRDELRRFLEGEPIHAKPPTPLQLLVRWYPKHASLMLGAYFVVSPLTWVFFIVGALLQSPQDEQFHLSSLVFLPWAVSWIWLGYMMLKRGFWFEIANVPVIVAFAMLPFFLDDDPQAYTLIALISLIGISLQVGAITCRILHAKRHTHGPVTDSQRSADPIRQSFGR